MVVRKRRQLITSLVALCALLLLVHQPASAQVSSTTGAIEGKVVDNTKGVVPGVTVTLTGPAIMGARTTVSEADGTYRLPILAPGRGYTLVFELSGFSKVTRQDVVIASGVTTTINIELSLASVTEDVVVTSESPVVDVTATNVTTHYDNARMIAALGSRDYTALLAAVPGVQLASMDVGGSNAITNIGYVSYGLKDQNRGEVEGIYTSENVTGGSDLNYSNFNSFEDFAVNAIGNNAEMSQPGNWSSVISKSGGNQYHGSLYQDYEPSSLETHNIDANDLSRGVHGGGLVANQDVNRLDQFHDFNGDIGGFVKKDKLWWYASHRRTHVGQHIAVITDGPENFDLTIYSEKVTYQISPNNRLAFYNTRGTKLNNDYGIGTAITPASALWDETYPTGTISGTYEAVLNQRAVAVFHVGDWYDRSFFIGKCDQVPDGRGGHGSGPCHVQVQDVGANTIVGTKPSSIQGMDRPQANGSMSYLKDGWGGSHSFKVGGEWLYDKVHSAAPNYGNEVEILNNGVPSQIQLWQPYTTSLKRANTMSGYVQDQWRLNSRVTLNVGVRFDHNRSYTPAQTGPYGLQYPQVVGAVFNNTAPRVGIVWAVTKDLKTVVKANYGQYWNHPGPDFAGYYIANSNQNYSTYVWNDPNPVYDNLGLPVFIPGQQGRLISTTGANPNGTAAVTVDPNLQNMYTRQALAYVEREVGAGFGVRTGFVWNGYRNGYSEINTNAPFSAFDVPVSVCVPGTNGAVPNPCGQSVTAYNLDPAYVGLPAHQVITNTPYTNSNYYTWEATANKRLSGRWSMLAAFSTTVSREGPIGRMNTATYVFTPNTLINTTNGTNHYSTANGKISGTYDWKWGVRLTPMYRYQLGAPFLASTTAGQPAFFARLNYSSVVPIKLATSKSMRADSVHMFDLRIEKNFDAHLGKLGSKFGVMFDAYNILNTNAAQAETITYGSTYLRPTSIVGPRIFRFGGKFSF